MVILRLKTKSNVSRYFYLLSTAGCTILLSGSQARAANNLMPQIHQDYVSGNYSAALAKLATAKPSPMVYYYSGLCYQGSNQLQLAKHQYSMVLQTSKDKKLRYHSQLAIASLERYAATRSYKGQGNNFLKPVNRNVPGGNSFNIDNNRMENPMYNRSFNPGFSLNGESPMYSRTDNPMYVRTYNPVNWNPTYDPIYRR